jgi:hypothetical protein
MVKLKEEIKFKLFRWAAGGAILGGFLLLGLIGYMMFYPITPVKYLDDRFEVSPLVVKPGEFINIHLRYDKFIDSPAHIKISFVDTIITDALNYTSLRKRGSYDHWRKVAVPKGLLPGRYHLEFTVQYEINPLRTERAQTRSIYFDVV